MNIQAAITLLVGGGTLTFSEAQAVMTQIVEGGAADAQLGAFLTALRMKGESVEEIAAFASVLRGHCVKINPTVNGALVDTAGTGGDSIKTFNVSTVAAIVAAAAGAKVAKHGGRAVSSRCGSADILEALGVNVAARPDIVRSCIERVGIGFMYAPIFHPVFKSAAQVRKDIGIRTVFNILGPLTNPASANRQLVGVSEPALTERMCGALGMLGSQGAYVVHGLIGIDEISILGATRISEFKDGKVTTNEITPQMFGLKEAQSKADITAGDPQTNLRITVNVLQGRESSNLDMVLLNAGAVLNLAGVAHSIAQGVDKAREAIASGRVLDTLQRFVKESDGDPTRLEKVLHEFSN